MIYKTVKFKLSSNIPYMVFLICCFVNNTCLQKVNYFNSPSCSNGDIALANGSKSQTGHVCLSSWGLGGIMATHTIIHEA